MELMERSPAAAEPFLEKKAPFREAEGRSRQLDALTKPIRLPLEIRKDGEIVSGFRAAGRAPVARDRPIPAHRIWRCGRCMSTRLTKMSSIREREDGWAAAQIPVCSKTDALGQECGDHLFTAYRDGNCMSTS